MNSESAVRGQIYRGDLIPIFTLHYHYKGITYKTDLLVKKILYLPDRTKYHFHEFLTHYKPLHLEDVTVLKLSCVLDDLEFDNYTCEIVHDSSSTP